MLMRFGYIPLFPPKKNSPQSLTYTPHISGKGKRTLREPLCHELINLRTDLNVEKQTKIPLQCYS